MQQQRPNLSNVPILRSNVGPPPPPYDENDYPELTSPNNEYSTLERALLPNKPYDPSPLGAGYSILPNTVKNVSPVSQRPPMPLPRQSIYGNIGSNRAGIPVSLKANQYMNTGGRRLTRRKSTRRHRKTKHCRRLNKKKNKKSKKRT